MQVVYAAGINEKLLGDFIRKHNVRDKIFSECPSIPRDGRSDLFKKHSADDVSLQLLLSAALLAWMGTEKSPTRLRTSRLTSREPSRDLDSLQTCTTCIALILVCTSSDISKSSLLTS